jgi:hypothetical protein
MNPTVRQVHVDRVLTNMSIAYMQQDTQFIASKVFPPVPVTKRSDMFRVYTKDDWFRDEAAKRAPGTESAGGGYQMGTDNYFCDTYAFHKDIDDQTRDNADEDVNLDRDATNFVTQRLLLKREKLWVGTSFVPGVWAKEYQGVAVNPNTGAGEFLQMNDVNSDPRTLIKAGRRQIVSTTGFRPNTIVMHYDVFDALVDNPDLVDRIKYTSRESITEDTLAQVFGVERVLVAGAIENTAKEGQAPAVMDFVYGKHMLLCYVAKSPGLMTPSAGYTFTWSHAPLPATGDKNRVALKRFRIEEIESERIEGQMSFDDKVVATDLGVLFKNVVP